MVLGFETNSTSNEEKIFNNLGGPHGLGDPNDRSLRRVEKEVMIPKIMRDRAKQKHCSKEVKEFESCCKSHNLLMVIKCRQENSALKDCLGKWYKNEQFQNECKEIYLEERADYRRTGVPKKQRLQKI